MPRRILLLGAAAAMLAGVAWLFRSGLIRGAEKPNFLLVTLDTTRADRLGCYGYSAAATPVLDALAAEGVLCERAFTVAPITLPSHTAMFTGLYPAENGVVTNGRGRLDDSIPTLAEVLQREGYDTGAFVATFVLNRKFGLERGFRTYDDDFADEEAAPDARHRQRHGQSVVDAALKWLGVKRDKPFFCWVHLYDPHDPYLPHTDVFGDKYADRPYDAEIAYVDMQVGRLVDFLKSQRLDTRTLMVVAGDHGEGLEKHVERRHGLTLYNDTLQVPLIFRQVGKLPARRLAGNVSLIDLSPSVLDLLGLKDQRKISGKSLKQALAGGEMPSRLVYGATDDPFLNNDWSPVRSLIDGDWKYVRTTKPELYNLTDDHDEQRNVLESEPFMAKLMAAKMVEFEARFERLQSIAVQLSANEERALVALGYLGGRKAGRNGAAPAELPDVKDMLPLDNAIDDAMKLAQAGSTAEAIRQLQEVNAKAPRHSDAYWYLAQLLRDASQLDEAERVLRSRLKIDPDSSHGHYGLALVLAQKGEAADAVAEFQRTLEIDPDNADAHYRLARLLSAANLVDDALGHYNAALEIDTQLVAAYQWRANLLVRVGRTAAAIADYRMAVKYAPDAAEAHHNLGVLLAQTGETDDARRHLARAVELSPESVQLQFALGVFLSEQRQFDEAIVHLAKAVELKPGDTAAEEELEKARQARAAAKGAIRQP